jgi:hypothetical protein
MFRSHAGRIDAADDRRAGGSADGRVRPGVEVQDATGRETIQVGKKWVKVEENVLFIKVNKQRGGLPSGATWLCRIDFARNEIAPEAQA